MPEYNEHAEGMKSSSHTEGMKLPSFMSPEEETFFREAKVPVRLAAAAYSASISDDKHTLPFIAGSSTVMPVSQLLKPYLHLQGDSMQDIMVHVVVMPVKLSKDAKGEGRTRPKKVVWDLALVYRGTQPYNVSNWITDFTFDQEQVDDYILRHTDPKQQKMVLAHRGFLRAFRSIHPRPATDGHSDLRVSSVVDSLKEEVEATFARRHSCKHGPSSHQDPDRQKDRARMLRRQDVLREGLRGSPRRILCIGHSLGGALATLGAAWCSTTLVEEEAFRHSTVHCITIGSPRVGNGVFAEAWEDLLLGGKTRKGFHDGHGTGTGTESLTYRIVNAMDPVPSSPPSKIMFYDYKHVGKEVYLERQVEDWSVNVIPHVDTDRPWQNTGSVTDHMQWHYTAAMVAAETLASQRKKADRGGPRTWYSRFKKQLDLWAVWKMFVHVLQLDLSLREHLWLLCLSWGLVIVLISLTSFCWLALFCIMTFLLPAVSFCVVLDFAVRPLLLPLDLLFPSKEPRPPNFKLSNLSLAVLSPVVMVITYVAAWVGM